jgi:hypothetical protein
MRKHAFTIIAMLGFFLMLTTATHVSAQTKQAFKVSIPFNFSIGRGEELPAGEYIVTLLASQVRMVRKADGHAYLTPLTRPNQARRVVDGSRLVFNNYGEKYFLAQVWIPVDSAGVELYKSSIERMLERESKGKPDDSATVKNIPTRRTVSVTASKL